MELAVITGAARGIGAATALRLARDGWSLILLDACRDQPPLDYPMPAPHDLAEIAARCEAEGARSTETIVADAGDPGVRETLAGTLDGRAPTAAISVAGIIQGHRGWGMPDDAWDLQLRVNLNGVRHLADACLPAMVEAGRGRFVAVASAAALRAMPMLAAYSAAKSAVLGYVRALAADLAGTGVTANTICPGSTRGAMLEASAAVYDLPSQDTFAAQALQRRLLAPEEVAAAITWLCGPEATALTGATLPIDAGLTA